MKTEQIKINYKYNESTDKIEMEINISDGLKELLTNCITKNKDTINGYNNLIRYKVKTPIVQNLINWELLFTKTLVDSKKLKLDFDNIDLIHDMIRKIKNVIPQIYQNYATITDKTITLSFEIHEDE